MGEGGPIFTVIDTDWFTKIKEFARVISKGFPLAMIQVQVRGLDRVRV